MKRVVILLGSPHKHGNTEVLAKAFAEGAEEHGAKVQLFRLGELDVGYCVGCDSCRKNGGVCVQKDDMTQILAAIWEADVVVFASPLYFMNLSAQIKACIDRFYACYHSGSLAGNRQAVLLMTSGGPVREGTKAAYAAYRAVTDLLGWTDAGMIWTGGYPQDGSIAASDAVAEAHALGRDLT